MTLGELRAWVLRTIKRPELSTQALDAINAAIEQATAFGDFAKDIVEGTIAIDATLYAQSLVIATEFPRFRKIKYLRPVGYNHYLKWRDPSRIFNEKGIEQVDVYYRAGANIVFKLCKLQSSMLYGYFAQAVKLTVAEDNTEPELLNVMPTALHDLAVARLYDDNGNEAEAQRIERRALRLLSQHKADLQDGVVHA